MYRNVHKVSCHFCFSLNTIINANGFTNFWYPFVLTGMDNETGNQIN